MELPVEMLDAPSDGDPAEFEAAWAEAIEQRVADIRNGTGHWPGVERVLAELAHCEAEFMDGSDDGDDDDCDDPAEIEAAWAAEIQRRVDEVRSGRANTYAAEDVIAALRIRFG